MSKKTLKKIRQRELDKQNLEQALKDENWQNFLQSIIKIVLIYN